jgi:hypothetical protein
VLRRELTGEVVALDEVPLAGDARGLPVEARMNAGRWAAWSVRLKPQLRQPPSVLLRRTRHRPATRRIRVGSLELGSLSRQVWVRGERVALSKNEFALLPALAGAPTRVLTNDNSGLSRGARDSRDEGIGVGNPIPCPGRLHPARAHVVLLIAPRELPLRGSSGVTALGALGLGLGLGVSPVLGSFAGQLLVLAPRRRLVVGLLLGLGGRVRLCRRLGCFSH